MSYRKLDVNGKPLPRAGRASRKEAVRRERGDTLYHYEIVVSIPQGGGRYRMLRRRHWLRGNVEAAAKENELKRGAPPDALTWVEAHRRWIEGNGDRFSESHRTMSEHTMKLWVESFGAASTIEGTGLAPFTQWVTEQAEGNTGRIAQVRRGHLLAMARWCRRRGLVSTIPFEHSPKPPAKLRKRGPATPEQFYRIAELLPDHMRPLWLFLGYTGTRLSAACDLLVKDVDGEGFWVTTKGRKWERYPMVPAIAALFKAAEAWRKKRKFESETVFCNLRGNRWTWTSYGHELRKRLKDKPGLEGVTAHRLRHMAGTIMGEQNLSPDIIKATLLHESLKSTEGYVDQTQRMRAIGLSTVVKILSKSDAKKSRTSGMQRKVPVAKMDENGICACPHCHGNLKPIK